MTFSAAHASSRFRLGVFLLSAILALLLAFFFIPDLPAIWFVGHVGYWIILGTFLIFGWAVVREYYGEARDIFRARIDWPALVVIGLSGFILLVHESFGFKIMMDEIMLLGTSMSMHFDKTVMVPERGNDIQGTFVILSGILDKRPLFFPFLVSLLHDLLGYRPANVFILNGILTYIFLALSWKIVVGLAGRWAGFLVVILWAGLPLLAQNATGGGFELLNLTMITVTMVLGVRYWERRDSLSLIAFAYAGLLLAQVRYESVIYLLPVAIVIIKVWWKERAVQLPWPLLLAPLLMVHYPLQNRIFNLRTTSWELMSKPGYTVPFSFSYISENLYHAFRFFFGRATEQPNSIVLSALTFLALPFFVLLLVRRAQHQRLSSGTEVVFYIFALGFAAQFALLMCYFWGKFDDHVISRLSLPTILFLLLALACVLAELNSRRLYNILIGVAVTGLLALSIPSMSARAYDQEYSPAREVAWRRQFMAAHPRRDYLMIDNESILWITHQVTATPILQALQRRDSIIFHFRNRTFSDYFVFQRFDVDPDTGKQTIHKEDDLGPDFVLEPFLEARLRFLTLTRISRVTDIRAAGAARPSLQAVLPAVSLEKPKVEKAREAYFENYIKELP